MPPGDLRRDLWFETKAVLFQSRQDFLDDLAAEYLITGLHVGQVQVRETVRERGQELVAQVMPVIQHAVRMVTQKARAVHDVGLALDERLQEPREFGRVVFVVRVLNDDELARGVLEAGPQRPAFALVFLVEDHLDRIQGILFPGTEAHR